MAINFLNNISLNYAELQNPRIWPLSTNPTNFPFGESGTVAEKQAYLGTTYFNTAIGGGLKIWTQTGSSSSDFSFSNVGGSFTLTADGPSGANSFVVAAGTTVDLLGGTNITTSRGGGAASNQFTITTTATPDQTVTLSGAVTGTGTTAIVTTLQQVVDTSKFVASALTKSDEDFSNQGSGATGDSQVPTTKSVYNYVNLVATGNLKFMGGFNAATGAITSGPNSGGNITEDIAIAIGDYYVVTVLGNFYATLSPAPSPAIPLTPGDNVIGTTARTAGATLSASDWSVVQADRDVATATTIGAGNTESSSTSGIDVAYTSPSDGTATLSLDVDEITASTEKPVKVLGTDSSGNTRTFTDAEFFQHRFKNVSLDSTSAAITRSFAGGITTFVVDVSNAVIFGTVGSALNTTVEILDHNDGATVYAEITRSDATELNIAFLGNKADTDYDVLLTNVG